jgi:hypothetical protein|nr:MAG TPA: hypothetical protein [Caudoviricetes sp.]
MIATEDRLAHALETAIENLEFMLDAASIDFDILDSPNINQYIIAFAEGERRAYVTAELSWDDKPIVFVDIYSVDADGGERWVCGDMSVDAAVLYIADA